MGLSPHVILRGLRHKTKRLEADECTLDMCCTCMHAYHMSTMIQIRNVPDQIHRTLKARAAMAGMSLSEFLLREITSVANRPTMEDFVEQLSRRPVPSLSEDSVTAVRRERDAQP